MFGHDAFCTLATSESGLSQFTYAIISHAGFAGPHEERKKKRRKSAHQRAQQAVAEALARALSGESPPLLEPSAPHLAAMGDPLAAIRTDLARINQQKLSEEDDLELLLMSI